MEGDPFELGQVLVATDNEINRLYARQEEKEQVLAKIATPPVPEPSPPSEPPSRREEEGGGFCSLAAVCFLFFVLPTTGREMDPGSMRITSGY